MTRHGYNREKQAAGRSLQAIRKAKADDARAREKGADWLLTKQLKNVDKNWPDPETRGNRVSSTQTEEMVDEGERGDGKQINGWIQIGRESFLDET